MKNENAEGPKENPRVKPMTDEELKIATENGRQLIEMMKLRMMPDPNCPVCKGKKGWYGVGVSPAGMPYLLTCCGEGQAPQVRIFEMQMHLMRQEISAQMKKLHEELHEENVYLSGLTFWGGLRYAVLFVKNFFMEPLRETFGKAKTETTKAQRNEETTMPDIAIPANERP